MPFAAAGGLGKAIGGAARVGKRAADLFSKDDERAPMPMQRKQQEAPPNLMTMASQSMQKPSSSQRPEAVSHAIPSLARGVPMYDFGAMNGVPTPEQLMRHLQAALWGAL